MSQSSARTPSTKEAVAQVLAGDVEAYAALVQAHQAEVWRLAAYALRDRAATEDLVQQVFLTAYEKLDRYDPERDFGAWLRTIARNQVRNELRRTARETRWMRRYRDHVERRLERSAGAGVDGATGVDDVDAAAEALRAHLAECRKELAEPAQRALSLRYEQSQGFDEIAEALGRTVAATRQLLTRVRLALRRCLEARRATA